VFYSIVDILVSLIKEIHMKALSNIFGGLGLVLFCVMVAFGMFGEHSNAIISGVCGIVALCIAAIFD